MKRPKVIVLIGNIGSGKSTLVKKYVKKGYVVICRDSLRYMIGGGKYIFNTKYERAIHRSEKLMYEQFLKLGLNIIIDEVGISKAMRSEYIRLAQMDYYPPYEVIAMELPKLTMKESVERRMKNPHGEFGKTDWEDVWRRFDLLYEQPTKLEGFDKVIQMRRIKNV